MNNMQNYYALDILIYASACMNYWKFHIFQGNAELLSISSDDSIWNSGDEENDDGAQSDTGEIDENFLGHFDKRHGTNIAVAINLDILNT